MKAHKYLIAAVMLAGFCCGLSPDSAADEPEDFINYAYSSWIGSGFYKFGIALSSKKEYSIFGLFDLSGGGLDVTFGDGYFGMA